MLGTFLDKASGLLNRRFLAAYWFPSLFAALLLLLSRALVHGLGESWRSWMVLFKFREAASQGSSQLGLLVAGLLLITLIAYILQVFTRPLIRTYEGYTWPLVLRRWATGRKTRRWRVLKKERAEAAGQDDLARYTHSQDKLFHAYPDQGWLLLPTDLGNVLRAAEEYPSRTYGVDAAFWWPRLWPLLPKKCQKAVDDALTTLVALLNSATLMVCVAVWVAVDVALYLRAGAIAHRAGWVVAALVLGGLLAVVAYRGAVAQARSYGQQIRTAIDLYRFKLLKALHLRLPSTPQEERALWERLAAWLYNSDLGVARDLSYDLGKKHRGPEEAGSG